MELRQVECQQPRRRHRALTGREPPGVRGKETPGSTCQTSSTGDVPRRAGRGAEKDRIPPTRIPSAERVVGAEDPVFPEQNNAVRPRGIGNVSRSAVNADEHRCTADHFRGLKDGKLSAQIEVLLRVGGGEFAANGIKADLDNTPVPAFQKSVDQCMPLLRRPILADLIGPRMENKKRGTRP